MWNADKIENSIVRMSHCVQLGTQCNDVTSFEGIDRRRKKENEVFEKRTKDDIAS